LNRRIRITLATGLAILGCEAENQDAAPMPIVENRAQQLAQETLLIDTHIDVPYRLHIEWDDVSQATDGGNFDYPRAIAGGLNAGFMSIYTDPTLEAKGLSREVAEELLDIVDRLVADSPEKFALALSPADVEDQFRKGLISLPIGMENGSPIEGNLDNVQYFFERGVRYITLAHGLSNHIADSSYDDNRPWGGLSDFGVEVVHEMNRLGIMIDVSHLSDDASLDILNLTAAPIIASHSSVRHFTPGWERNLSDELIRKIADNDGVVMVSFGSVFLTQEARVYEDRRDVAYDKYLTEQNIDGSDALEDAFNLDYSASVEAYPYATMQDLLNHFDHIVELVGVDHVGIGSDFDGVGDSLPFGLKGVDGYPNLIGGFIGRGYSDGEIEKMLGGNLIRVWREVERYAATGARN